MTEAPLLPPFWVVRRMPKPGKLRKNGNFYRHPSRDAAIKEARRLSAQFAGDMFVVLEAVHIEVTEAVSGP